LIILIGFEPFDSYSRNLSKEIIKLFPNKIQNITIVKKVLLVSWKESAKQYRKLIKSLQSSPQLVILLGIHSENAYCIEKFGWNLAFGMDNYNDFKSGPISFNAKLRIRSLLDVQKLQSKLGKFMKIRVSHYAGYYLCNYLYFIALKISEKRYPVIFAHLPSKEKINPGIKNVNLIIKSIIELI
jgi:pyrrolidone-carboxylate peptidase